MLRTYIAQLRVGFDADSDVHAEATAEGFVDRLNEVLEEDDTARVTQVLCIGEPLREDEVINHLRLARNDLARLHYRDTMNLAQQVDMVIWKLAQISSDEDSLPNDYDYDRIIRLKEALNRKENPLW